MAVEGSEKQDLKTFKDCHTDQGDTSNTSFIKEVGALVYLVLTLQEYINSDHKI